MGDAFASRLDAVFGKLQQPGQPIPTPLWTVSGKQDTRPGKETGYSSEEDDEANAPQPLMRGDVMASDDDADDDPQQERPSMQYSK
jgi:hypothetical protein